MLGGDADDLDGNYDDVTELVAMLAKMRKEQEKLITENLRQDGASLLGDRISECHQVR